MHEFINKKTGDKVTVLEKEYTDGIIIWLNSQGYKELFHNAGDNNE